MKKRKEHHSTKNLGIWFLFLAIIKGFFKALWWILKHAYLALMSMKKSVQRSAQKRSLKIKESRIPPKHAQFMVKETIAGVPKDFFSTITVKSLIILIFGRRGSGKSALGFRILENVFVQTKRPCFALG